MNAFDSVGWGLIEEAVIRDKGYDEETALSAILHSYLIRRGFVDTIAAMREENQSPQMQTQTQMQTQIQIQADMRRRKRLQSLCLREEYTAAAALLPDGSVERVRLLALSAARMAPPAAALFLCRSVGPRVAHSDDPVRAHRLFADALAAAVRGDGDTRRPSPCGMARAVNAALLGERERDALEVLLAWSEWQQMVTQREGKKGTFPFTTQTGRE